MMETLEEPLRGLRCRPSEPCREGLACFYYREVGLRNEEARRVIPALPSVSILGEDNDMMVMVVTDMMMKKSGREDGHWEDEE